MGCCQSSDASEEDKQVHKDITRMMRQDQLRMDMEISILLLGAGESGKSTLFKQMKIIHRNGYTPAECSKYKNAIHGNVLISIRCLIDAITAFGIQWEKEENKYRAAKIMDFPEQQVITIADKLMTPELGQDIEAVWRDMGIQRAYERRSELQLIDSAAFYLNSIPRLSSPLYSPTQQDVLRSRVRTVGIVVEEFEIDRYKFRFVDVGGQRNERRKWISQFDNVSAILFVTSLSEYDQNLYEDEEVNRMRESLMLFDEVCNSRYFTETAIIIFFNKVDLFSEKIKSVDLKVCFPDYKDGCDEDRAKRFILEKFVRLNRSPQRQIFYHFTNATDTNNIRVVFNAVKSVILSANLARVNLV